MAEYYGPPEREPVTDDCSSDDKRTHVDTFVVEDLRERVLDGDEVGLVGHDLIDVLVGAGVFVDEGLGVLVVPRLALHLGTQGLDVEVGRVESSYQGA